MKPEIEGEIQQTTQEGILQHTYSKHMKTLCIYTLCKYQNRRTCQVLFCFLVFQGVSLLDAIKAFVWYAALVKDVIDLAVRSCRSFVNKHIRKQQQISQMKPQQGPIQEYNSLDDF